MAGMDVPRSNTPTLRFAEVARRLGAAAHAHGLAVPAFRSPPRTPGVARTLRRYPGGTVVSVRLRDRPFPAVVADMVDGVLAANRVAPSDADALRAALHASVDDLARFRTDEESAAPSPVVVPERAGPRAASDAQAA